MRSCLFLGVLFGFYMFPRVVKAQEDIKETDSLPNYELSEVVITATRTLRQLSSLPLQVQLVKEKEIRSINSSRLSDVLAEQTGLITIPGHTGGEGIQMQGLDVAYTLILVDEMPLVGRTIGQLDLNRISVGDIQQIEIVKGASSSLYGSEALGGVINIITKIPTYGWSATLNHRQSTFETHDTSVNLGYKKEKLEITSYANLYGSDGYNLLNTEVPTVTPYYNATARTKVKYAFSNRTDLSVSFRYFMQNQDYVSTQEKGKSQIREWNAHTKLNNKYNERWSSFFELYATRYKTFENVDQSVSSDSDANFNQHMIRPEIRGKFSPKSLTNITAGLGANFDGVEKTYFISDSKMQSYYLYGQLDTYLTEKLNLIGGFRFDLHSEYASQFSPKVAMKYDFSTKIAVKASAGYGYKAPDFRQLYNNFLNSSVGYTVLGYNAVPVILPELIADGEIQTISVDLDTYSQTDLKPESSLSFNVGTMVSPSEKIKVELNFFRNDIKNLIDTQVIATKVSGSTVFSYYNAYKVYTQGIEFNAKYNWSKNVTLSGGYQLLYAKDKEVEKRFKEGRVYARGDNNTIFQLAKNDYFGLVNRSRHSANLKLFYNISSWRANANLRAVYRSKYAITDSNGNNYIDKYDTFVDGYATINAAINKNIGEYVVLGVGSNNMFDYTDPQNISNLPGRMIYINLNINF